VSIVFTVSRYTVVDSSSQSLLGTLTSPDVLGWNCWIFGSLILKVFGGALRLIYRYLLGSGVAREVRGVRAAPGGTC